MVWDPTQYLAYGDLRLRPGLDLLARIPVEAPERVVDLLQRLNEEISLDYLMCAPLSHSSFLTFTEKVLPKFV